MPFGRHTARRFGDPPLPPSSGALRLSSESRTSLGDGSFLELDGAGDAPEAGDTPDAAAMPPGASAATDISSSSSSSEELPVSHAAYSSSELSDELSVSSRPGLGSWKGDSQGWYL